MKFYDNAVLEEFKKDDWLDKISILFDYLLDTRSLFWLKDIFSIREELEILKF